MQFKHVDAHKYAMHLDMMKGYDTVLITHGSQQADTQTGEDDIEVVSPQMVMRVVNPQYAPPSDLFDGMCAESKASEYR